jgi:hypothetical protein
VRVGDGLRRVERVHSRVHFGLQDLWSLVGNNGFGRHSSLSGGPLVCGAALVRSKVLHAIVLSAESSSASGFWADIVLFPSVNAGVSRKMARGGEGLSALAGVAARGSLDYGVRGAGLWRWGRGARGSLRARRRQRAGGRQVLGSGDGAQDGRRGC